MLKRIIILSSYTLLFLSTHIALALDVISTNIDVDNSPNSVIEDQVVAQFIGASPVAGITDLGLPSAADIAALHYVNDTTVLFTLKSAAQLGPLAVHAGDILQWQNGNLTKIVTGTQLGISPATSIDALTRNGDALVFSTNIADVVNGMAISDSDLLSWSEGNATKLLVNQSECGIPDEANLSGVHLMDTGYFLMTFSSAAMIQGIPARAADVVQCNPNTNTVTLYRRFSDLGTNWAAVNIDAISQSLSERIFLDGFEN